MKQLKKMKLNNITIIIAIAIFFAGMLTQFKLTKTPVLNCPEIVLPKCPDCNCPPNVSVQQLDTESLRKIKGDFVYQPQFSGTVIMQNCPE